jgi:hypothetical protein
MSAPTLISKVLHEREHAAVGQQHLALNPREDHCEIAQIMRDHDHLCAAVTHW